MSYSRRQDAHPLWSEAMVVSETIDVGGGGVDRLRRSGGLWKPRFFLEHRFAMPTARYLQGTASENCSQSKSCRGVALVIVLSHQQCALRCKVAGVAKLSSATEHTWFLSPSDLCRARQCTCGEDSRSRWPVRSLSKAAVLAFCLISLGAGAQELSLSPTRPTIANSAPIQNRGVLQVEIGYDGYPQHVPGDQQTAGANFSYVPLNRLRLDFGWSPYSQQENDGERAAGVGTMQIGGKIVLLKENYGLPAPGMAIQYEAELPTASERALQGSGQQFIFLVNHHYGRKGIVDVILNGSLVQSDCQTQTGCSYGGQHSFALSYHLRENTRLYAEVFGQNNSQSNTPPGTYVFSGFYQKVRDAFGIDGGMRFGVTDHSASVGVTLGVVFGKRLQRYPLSK